MNQRPPHGPWKRVRCPICERLVPLTPLGVLRAHGPSIFKEHATVSVSGLAYCDGSWRAPELIKREDPPQ